MNQLAQALNAWAEAMRPKFAGLGKAMAEVAELPGVKALADADRRRHTS